MDNKYNDGQAAEEKRRKSKMDKDFENDYIANEKMLKDHKHIERQMESQTHEPNGVNPKSKFEKGLSFQEDVEQSKLERMDPSGPEPNSIYPQK